MRLFVAITLSETMRSSLVKTQNDMYDRGVRGNFTKEANLHITLAFIGEYPDPDPIMETLSTISFTPFVIELQGIGSFGDLWWVGIKDSAPLESLARRVRRRLSDTGIPFDRKRFSPHITLIRKSNIPVSGVMIQKESMTVDTISLMRSDRGKGRMIYTQIGVVKAHQ